MSRRLEIQVGEFVCPAHLLMSRAKSVGRPVDLGQRTRGLTKLQGSMTLEMHFARMSAERARMEAQVYRENSLLPSPSWLWVRTSAISCFQKVLTVTNEWNRWSALIFLVNGHIMLNAPVLVRSPKLSSIEPRQYLDGWPPGNTGCCWHSIFFSHFLVWFWTW